MGSKEFLCLCKQIVADYFNGHVDKNRSETDHRG